jgi:CspA family cold shock protein
MTWPIGFSSLIGCSFLILEEAVNPESAKDSVRYLPVSASSVAGGLQFPHLWAFLWKLGAFWRPFSFRARYDRGATQSCLEQIMSKGTVKWFNPTKGYGFIQPQGGGGRDVFVHISAVERAGLSSLNEGQVVEYEEVSNRGKTSAENLKVQR